MHMHAYTHSMGIVATRVATQWAKELSLGYLQAPVLTVFPFLCVPSSRRVYKEHLGLSMKTVIGYQAHFDTATKSNSLAKNKFVV